MMNLFYMGGTLFMSILTLIFFANIALAIYLVFQFGKNDFSHEQISIKLGYLKSVGLFALIFGILGQFIGLFSAFGAIEQVGTVSPAILAGGLKVSMITTMYGLVIYIISIAGWFGLTNKFG
ncbi:MAG: MotA/TolQ/ExbB proton channel family protein [Cyclobacteriaceae bacterium]